MKYTEKSLKGRYGLLYDQSTNHIKKYFYMTLNSIFNYPDSLSFLTFETEEDLAKKIDSLKQIDGWYMRDGNRIKRINK